MDWSTIMDYQLYDDIQKAAEGRSLKSVKEDVYNLWRLCFGDSIAYTNFYFEWKVPDNRILTIYNKDRLSAMLHLNPYTLMAAGKKVKSYYIVGVATRPEDRRKGLMKRLLLRALSLMGQEKIPFTYLMPAAEAIYLPYDFRMVYKQEAWGDNIYRLKQERINVNPKEELSVQWLKQENVKQLEAIVDFANSLLAEQARVYALRTPAYYKRLLAEMEKGKGSVVLCMQGERILGYTAYMAESGLQVAEALYQINYRQEFLNTMAKVLPDCEGNKDVTSFELENHTPAIMTRIVNWESFVKGLSAREKVCLVIKLEDSLLSNNNGCYKLILTEEGCQAVKTEDLPEVVGDAASLTRLFFGKLSKEEQKKLILDTKTDIILEKLNKINYYTPLMINDVV